MEPKKDKAILNALDSLRNEVVEQDYRYDWLTLDWVNENRPVSKSSLGAFRKSPQHYIDYVSRKKDPTASQVKGSIVDIFLLTPNEADDSIVIIPDFGDLRSPKNREQKAAFTSQYEGSGKLLISEVDYNTGMRMVESVYRDKDAMYYIDRIKKSQVKLEWTHKDTGLKNIGFVDGESDPESDDYFILELKTTKNADTHGFLRDAHQYEYHMQGGGYTLGYKKKYFRFPDLIFIAVDNVEPYGVNVFRADNKYIEKSQEEYHNTLLAFKYCLDHKEFDKSYAFFRFMTKYNRMELPYYFKPTFG